jgi:hypothetical protein
MAYDVYRITIKGHLDPEWSDWFDGLTVRLVDNGGRENESNPIVPREEEGRGA